eukprot:Phypoly_transcript_27158.p1 GENE.Phypoly_transcript_27158~~Phypoly_transcript_27158.p1  ORF type:complete len:159 (-),score=28.07 Phypoly_transcript_27158:6-428(-)
MAINVGTVWGMGTISYLFARSNILLSLPLAFLTFANAIVHILGAVKTGDYNPGLATAILLLLPLSGSIIFALRRQFSVLSLFLLFAFYGVFAHVLIFANLFALQSGKVPHFPSVVFWYLFGLSPFLMAFFTPVQVNKKKI